MKKITLLVFVAFGFISCSGDKQPISQDMKDHIENMTDSNLVKELLIKTEGDKEQLGRVLNCSIYTIDRIGKEESFLTNNSRKEFENLLFDIESNGPKTLIERDSYYDSWSRSLKNTLNSWIWIIVISTVINLVLAFFIEELILMFILEVLIVGVAYLSTWIGNMISPYENPAFLFIEKINPLVETLL